MTGIIRIEDPPGVYIWSDSDMVGAPPTKRSLLLRSGARTVRWNLFHEMAENDLTQLGSARSTRGGELRVPIATIHDGT